MSTWEEWAKNINERLAAIDEKLKWQEKRTDTAFEQINKLRQELILDVFLESMTEQILVTLKEEPHVTQRKVMEKLLAPFSEHPMCYHGFYDAWKQLEKNAVIISEHHGKGHLLTWVISIDQRQRKPQNSLEIGKEG